MLYHHKKSVVHSAHHTTPTAGGVKAVPALIHACRHEPNGLERELPVAAHLCLHHAAGRVLAPDECLRKRRLKLALDGPLHGPCAVDRVKADLCHVVKCVLRHLQLDLLLRQTCGDLAQLQAHNLPQLVLAQGVEDHVLVHPVEELGAEGRLHRAHHAGAHLLALVGVPAHVEDVGAADVGGEDDDRVPEVHGVALGVSEPAVIQKLQHQVENVRMCLLHLIEQHHRVGARADGVRELAALVVAHVAGRGAHQPGDRVLLHVLRHVDPDEGLLAVEELRG
mmetsp:Transcript_12336/g.17124  ORF Transcript_12336/g.17124 Transcript_12336/m.17124 type:complete len:280 (-) Transcript_12336:208-1047(-)